MPHETDKVLSTVEAARLMYRTKSPTPAQVGHVLKLIKAGSLQAANRDGSPAHWTTSEAAIADFFAHQSAEKQSAEKQAAEKQAAGQIDARRPADARSLASGSLAPSLAKSPADAIRLQALYQGLWRDYFLAVLLRRRAAHRSVAFHRAVLAGQVLTLLLLIAAMFAAVGLTTEFASPEQVAIKRYLDNQNDHYTILQWHPPEPSPDGNGTILRVEYSYRKDSPRPVQTDRRFLVQGDSVSELPTDD